MNLEVYSFKEKFSFFFFCALVFVVFFLERKVVYRVLYLFV